MKVKEFIKDEKLNTSNNLIKKPVVSIIMPTYCRGAVSYTHLNIIILIIIQLVIQIIIKEVMMIFLLN